MSIQSEITRISDAKSTLSTWLTEQNVETEEGANLTSIAETIAGLSLGGGIEELTSPVRIWNLENGVYQLPASSTIYYYGSSNTSNSFTVDSTSILFVSKQSSYKYYFIIGGSSLVNYLYYGYSISSSGTNYSLKLNDIKIPTSTLAQYNLGYYATTSTITNLNSTSYVNPSIYGMNINAGTGIPTEITSGSQAILMVLVNKQAPSGVTYIRQDLYVPSKNKHWKRNVLFNGSSYTYPEWEEVVEDLSDYALKTEIPDVSNKQDTLVSGTNIKTINGTSLLGSGDITIESGSSGGGIETLSGTARLWDLAQGTYLIEPSTVIYYYGATSTSSFTLSGGGVLSISDGNGSYKGFEIVTAESAEAYIYLGATYSSYGFYSKISRVNLQNARACTYTSSQKAIGYYNETSTVSNLNNTMYIQPNEWSITISTNTTGAPSDITGSTKVYISTKAPGFTGGLSSSLTPYMRQDMYAPSLNKHWYRIVNYSDSSNVIYPEWIEIKENTDKVAIELTGVNSSSSYDCYYFPATGMVWFSMYLTGLTTTASSRTTVATVPEGYRPSRRTALATDELQDATANIKATVTSAGEITLLTGVAKSSSDDQYISGWWYVPTE